MNLTKNKLVIIALIVIFGLLLYLNSEALIDSLMIGKLNLKEWLATNSFVWVPALFTFCFGLLVGWLLFRKRV